MNNKHLILVITAITILLIPFIFSSGSGKAIVGSDDQAASAIENTGYQPWYSSIWEPPSSEIESLLFAAQAAIGAIILFYVLFHYRSKNKPRNN